jgi:hypothetical protein
MTDEPRHDQTTADEALGPQEKADAVNPNVGEGTPATAPERPVPETLIEKTRRLLRRH